MHTRSFLTGCSVAAASLFLVTAGSGLCRAQQASDQSSYLELNWMRAKQDKVAEFGQTLSRIADANRRGKGDTWIAYADMYGRDNYVWLASGRESLSAIEPGFKNFSGALKEFMGMSVDRFMAEASKTVESSGAQLWRHRFDLSWNVKDTNDWQAQLGKSHFMAVVTLHVKPGRMVESEKQIKMVADAMAGSETKNAGLVSQVVMGGDPGTFYVRIPLGSIEDVGTMMTARKALGEEGYKTYSEMAAQDYASIDFTLKRMVPEWSAPTAAIMQANPSMWKVKSMAAPKPKAPATEPKPAASAGE